MSLLDEHTSMVNRLCHASLEHEGLEPTLKEVLNSEGQDIIKLVLVLLQKTIPVHPAEKGFTFENSAWVLLVQGEKHSCSITNAAQGILNPP